jgi:hypothetical protein
MLRIAHRHGAAANHPASSIVVIGMPSAYSLSPWES